MIESVAPLRLIFATYGKLAPGILTLDTAQPRSAEGKALYLPHSFTIEEQKHLGLEALAMVETRLRIGQCYDWITKLREALGLKGLLLQTTRAHSRGFHMKTRSDVQTKRANDLVNRAARLYRCSWEAAIAHRGTKEIKAVMGALQVLKNDDMRTLDNLVEEGRFNRGNQPISWIWRMAPHLSLVVNPNQDHACASWSDEGK